MFTEYVFDKENDVAVRNLKATMFDIVANEEANMAKLQEKAAGETDEDLQAKLVELLDAQSNCLRDVVRITNALVETMQQLDSYSKGLRELEKKSVEKKLAGMTNSQEPELNSVSENERINSQVDEEVVSSDTIEQNADVQSPVEENVGLEAQEPQISDVAVSEDAVQGVEDSIDGVVSQTDEEVASNIQEPQSSDISDTQEIQEEPVQRQEEIVEDSPTQPNIEVGKTTEDVVSPVVVDSEVSDVAPIVATEETADTGVVPSPTIDDSVPIVENADSTVIDVPEISESVTQPTMAVNDSSFELPVIEADGLNNSVGQVQESTVALPVVTFTRVGNIADRAILVTNKQSTNLRNSRDMQKQIVQIANSGVTESQLVNNGLLEPSADDKKKKIEEMLENANLLYKQGNVQEAEVLYNEISKLNKELQGEEEKTLVA